MNAAGFEGITHFDPYHSKISAPAMTRLVPVKVFAPESVSVPVPVWLALTVAFPLASVPETRKLPAPMNVNVRMPVADDDIPPPKLSVPASD